MESILLAAFANEVGCAKRGKNGDAAADRSITSVTVTGTTMFTSVRKIWCPIPASVKSCTHAEETSLFIISSFLCVGTHAHAHAEDDCDCDY